MRTLLTLFLFFTFLFNTSAQQLPKNNGRIHGTVIDSVNAQGVEFATVALYKQGDSKPLDGTICDVKGKFNLTKIAVGDYTLVISFIGFKSKTIRVSVSENKHETDLGIIKINPDTELLNEVTVEGQKVLYEEKVDRTIYNAENDATTSGGDATDVLKRVPMLSVDLDGNVSLRGSQNIKVLINNKPSSIMASSIADALKQIPADQIKTVEVITSPSSRYDAEGSTGIINIILKKNTLKGATLMIDGSAGWRGSRLGLNGNLRTGKMGFSLGGHGFSGYNVKSSFNNQQTTFDINGAPQALNIQSSTNNNNYLFGRYNIGWDYDINKNNLLTASVSYGMRNQNSNQNNFVSQNFNYITNTELNTLQRVKQADLSGNVDASLTYTHLYQKPQREFNLMSLYSRNDRANNFERFSLDPTTTDIISKLKNLNDSFNEEFTVQADYQTPIGKTQILEAGGKQIMRQVTSDYTSYNAPTANDPYVASTNKSLSNIFNYDQNVSAAYLSYTLTNSKGYSVKGGARYEYTTIVANYQNEQRIAIPAYGALVPSVNLSKRLKKGNTIKLAYTRRLQRPSIQFLNPNIQRSNAKNISYGNPDLSPEFTDNVELSFSSFIKGSSINITTFARNTDNAIQSVRDVIFPDTIRTTYQNIGQESSYGASIFGNINISGKFSLNGGTDFYYSVLNNRNPDPIYNASNNGWVISGRLFGNYTIGKGWGIQFFAFYRGRQVQLQGKQGGMGMYNLGVRKEFNNKKASLGIGAMNFITPSIKINNELSSPIMAQKSTNIMYNTNLNVSFNLRLGKMSVDNNASRRRRKSINNDDLKGGGGDSNQGESAQPAPSGGGAAPAARPSGGTTPQGKPAPGGAPSGAPKRPNQ